VLKRNNIVQGKVIQGLLVLHYELKSLPISKAGTKLELFSEELRKYSDTEMYKATDKPIRLATKVFFWKIMQVAMHKPTYVRYRVMLMWYSRPYSRSSEKCT